MLFRPAAALLIAVTGFLSLPITASAQTITCSFYSNKLNGRRTASGQLFHNTALTAASKTLPFGARVRLTNPRNRHSVVVRVNDRGPFVPGRDLSVTRRAARRLGFLRAGVAQLEMEMLDGSVKTAKVKI